MRPSPWRRLAQTQNVRPTPAVPAMYWLERPAVLMLLLYGSEYNPYFKTNVRLFPALESFVQLLQHMPDPRAHLARRYVLYSSRSRGTYSCKPWPLHLAPEGHCSGPPKGWLQQYPHMPHLPSHNSAYIIGRTESPMQVPTRGGLQE